MPCKSIIDVILGCTPSSEPYFYETGYKHNCVCVKLQINRVKRCIEYVDIVPSTKEFTYESPIAIDNDGKAQLGASIEANKWFCSDACLPMADKDVRILLDLVNAFKVAVTP